MRAVYSIPFRDFDYEKLAKDCGATCAFQKDDRLIVTGTPEVINTLSANLDFGPDEEEKRMVDKKVVELDVDQYVWLIRHVKNSINHIEKHNPHIPARKKRLESFRVLLKQLESKEH